MSSIVLDVMTIVALVICVGIGVYWGAIRFTFSVASILVGSYIAARFYVHASQYVAYNDWALLFAFALIFFLSSFLIVLIGKWCSSLVQKALLNPVDRAIGGILFLIVAVIVIGYTYNVLREFVPGKKVTAAMETSRVISWIVRTDNRFYDALPKEITKKCDTLCPQKMGSVVEEQTKEMPKIVSDKQEEKTHNVEAWQVVE